MLGLCLVAAAVAAEPLRQPLFLEEERAGWSVYEGLEESLSAPAFAVRVSDLETVSALATERRIAARRRSLLTGAGIALLAGSALPWFLADYSVVEAISDDELNDGVSLTAVQNSQRVIIEDDRAWAGAFLAGSGLMVAVSGTLAWRGALERQTAPENYYPLEEAAVLIERYNERLQPAPDPTQTPAVEVMGGPEALMAPGLGPLGVVGAAGGW